ncbi:MAG: hypothetical protein HGA45_19695 [Chloroflexales bacterium]|nr:hypothetical protein [Chloroflexales bacterium]
MKITMQLLLAALLMLSFVIVTPAAARPAPVFCDAVLTDIVIRGDLLVPERSHCELNNVTVLGDVRMRDGAGFTPYDSRIAGSITGAQFELLHLLNSTVEGDIRLRGGVRAELARATVTGDVWLNDLYEAVLLESRVRGALMARGTNGQVQLCGSTVEGDASVVGNSGWIMVGGDLATCATNAVHGTLRVHHNQQAITVANNTVGQNLICAANDPAPTVFANQVRGKTRGQCGGNEPMDAQELAETE